MTAKEAIDILWQYDVNFEPHPAEEVMHAIDMAIEALNSSEIPNNSDLISRQAAIDALEKLSANYTGVGKREWHPHVRECQYEIQHMPSAQPERKKGRWIDAVLPNDSGGLQVQVCDQCNTFFPLAYTGGGHKFCPNCGADMRGEQE